MFAAQLFTMVLAFLAVGVQASPFSPRDVIDPRITIPTTGSVWPIGTSQIVSWDISNFPPYSQFTNLIGEVMLGFNSENGSMNLGIAPPLAQNFNLTVGSVRITVPNVAPRTDYFVVVMGDTRNTSPQFSITNSPTDTLSTAMAPLPTSTTPSSLSSTSDSAASSSASSASSTNGAWSLYTPERLSFKALSLSMVSMIILIGI